MLSTVHVLTLPFGGLHHRKLLGSGQPSWVPSRWRIPRLLRMSNELESQTIDLRKIAPRKLAEVNKEWWLLLALLVIAAVLNYFSALTQIIFWVYPPPPLRFTHPFRRLPALLPPFSSPLLT